jgi:hypothetical protein
MKKRKLKTLSTQRNTKIEHYFRDNPLLHPQVKMVGQAPTWFGPSYCQDLALVI